MARTRVPLLTGEGGGTPVNASPQRVFNMYPSADPQSKIGIAWKETPGWTEVWSTPNLRPIRASIIFKDEMYMVVGGTLLKLSTSSPIKTTVIGSLERSGWHGVHLAEDGINLMVTDELNMYRWDGTTYSAVTLPPSLTSPKGIIFHDGHFVCYQMNSGVFWISDKFDGSTWDALQFATAEDKPDNIIGLASDRVLWIFGDYTTQAYYNSGDVFPFKPNPQGLLIYGMVGTTQEQLDNTSYWLARSKVGKLKVVKANGFAPLAVSTPQLEEELSTIVRTDDAYSNTIMWEGHEWYILTFPTDSRTFVYDTQGVWFEWGDYDPFTDKIVAHPMLTCQYVANRGYVFGDSKGGLHLLEKGTYNHNGDVMSSGFVSNVHHIDEERMFLTDLVMDMRTGMDGDIEANGVVVWGAPPTREAAVMMLRISYDGGYTFGNWMSRKLGKLGKYSHRVQWHRLGSGFNIVIEGRITDEVPRQILSGVLGVEVHESYLDRRNRRSGVESGGE